ncbi:MAG: ferrochelatase [Arcanobacterium sp.]|nr:ferrochelatase [Arcanobacterium sp.]
MANAYLLLSYGGPNGPDDVLPFLRNATRGRGIPDARLAAVGKHYALFGGKSPINECNEELRTALATELAARGDHTPLFVANRNWHPYGHEVLRALAAHGVTHVRAIPTAAYASYSSCRQYSEDLEMWLSETGVPITAERAAPFWDTPGFFAAQLRIVSDAVQRYPAARLVFVTHSIPSAMDAASGQGHTAAGAYPCYSEQHVILARQLAARVGVEDWDLAYCSRSGSPHTPWLEPDICHHLTQLHQQGVREVTVIPIGFISDHMEVVYDLDTQARTTATDLGLIYHRAPTIGTAPDFVRQLADLLSAPDFRRAPSMCCPSKVANATTR